jgi:NADPH:quinone reductase-like Zn-dependent oxidoreductase
LNPITVCSPHNFDLVKSYGATAVFDYKQPSCIGDIRKHTNNSLKYVLDCVCEPDTMQFSFKCLARTGGRYSTLEPYAEFLHTRPRTVVADWVLGPSLLGEEITWPEPFTRQKSEELRGFGVDFFITAQKLLDEGQLKPHPIRLVSGGLYGVQEGLELLRKKQISGQKLVCSLA